MESRVCEEVDKVEDEEGQDAEEKEAEVEEVAGPGDPRRRQAPPHSPHLLIFLLLVFLFLPVSTLRSSLTRRCSHILCASVGCRPGCRAVLEIPRWLLTRCRDWYRIRLEDRISVQGMFSCRCRALAMRRGGGCGACVRLHWYTMIKQAG